MFVRIIICLFENPVLSITASFAPLNNNHRMHRCVLQIHSKYMGIFFRLRKIMQIQPRRCQNTNQRKTKTHSLTESVIEGEHDQPHTNYAQVIAKENEIPTNGPVEWQKKKLPSIAITHNMNRRKVGCVTLVTRIFSLSAPLSITLSLYMSPKPLHTHKYILLVRVCMLICSLRPSA